MIEVANDCLTSFIWVVALQSLSKFLGMPQYTLMSHQHLMKSFHLIVCQIWNGHEERKQMHNDGTIFKEPIR